MTLALTANDIVGRKMELLGRGSQIDMSAVDSSRVLFVTGNTDFRSGLSRVFVNFIVVETSDGLPLPVLAILGFGSASAYTDWAGPVSVGAAPFNVLGVPIILWPAIGLAQTSPPPVYANGVSFGVKNYGDTTTQLLTVSVYGWAEN